MNGVIKEFLVLLGMKVDGASEAKFVRAIEGATLRAKLLGDAIEDAARAVHGAVADMARDLEQLYFASQRTKASAENIRALQLALTQVGGSADGALAAVEGIARFMRTNPAGEGFIKSLGVQTRDANGALRDTSGLAIDLGKQLHEMPSWMAAQYGGIFGLDERTTLALQQNLGEAEATYHRFVAAAHLDLGKAAADSHGFMVAQRNATAAVGVLFDKLAGQMYAPLTAMISRATDFLVAHYDQISQGLEAIGKGILAFMSIVTSVVLRLGEAVGDLMTWFDGLDAGTQKVIEAAGALLIAWRLLSKGFLTTPLGLVIAGLTTLLLLLEDYSGWRSGKRSLIDWSLFDGGIQTALKGFMAVGGWMNDLVKATVGWQNVLEDIAILMAGSWLKRVLGAFGAAKAAATAASVATAGVGAGKPGAAGAATGVSKPQSVFRAFMFSTVLEQVASGVDEHVPALEKLDDAIFGSIARGLKQMFGAGSAAAAEAPGGVAAAGDGQGQAFGSSAGGSAQTPSVGNSIPSGPTETHSASDPRGIRNNNPGNLNFAGQRGAHLESGPNARFAAFNTMQEGLGALANQLHLYAARGVDTVNTIINKYAPGFENNTNGYIASVVRGTGLNPNAHLNLDDPATMQSLMKAITTVEVGRNRISDTQIAGGNDYFRGTPLMRSQGPMVAGGDTTTNAPVQHNITTIHVDGSGDPQATGRAIADQQSRVTQNGYRQLRGVVS